MPYIILIAEDDNFGLTARNGVLKVLRRASALAVEIRIDPKGNVGCELANVGRCVVRRTVVADHEFIGRPCLRLDTLQLLRKEASTVVGAHGYRDSHLVHRYSVPFLL